MMPRAELFYAGEPNYSSGTQDGTVVANALTPVAQANGFSTFTLFEKEGISPAPAACDLPLTHDNLVEHWSSSPTGLVAWTGHGSATASYRKIWTADTNGNGVPDANELSSPAFFSSPDTLLLDNSHPSIIFEDSCDNASPEITNNLAYSLLANGAIGTFAATRSEWGQSNPPWNAYSTLGIGQTFEYKVIGRLMQNPTTETLASSLQWARENLRTPMTNIFGDVTYMYWQDCLVFNLCGDPTVTLLNQANNPGMISGTVWEDTNGDGLQETGETGTVPGATVFLDTNANGLLDPGERFTVSDAQGRYLIGGLPDGYYTVSIAASANFA